MNTPNKKTGEDLQKYSVEISCYSYQNKGEVIGFAAVFEFLLSDKFLQIPPSIAASLAHHLIVFGHNVKPFLSIDFGVEGVKVLIKKID